jgi:hypothetical protein
MSNPTGQGPVMDTIGDILNVLLSMVLAGLIGNSIGHLLWMPQSIINLLIVFMAGTAPMILTTKPKPKWYPIYNAALGGTLVVFLTSWISVGSYLYFGHIALEQIEVYGAYINTVIGSFLFVLGSAWWVGKGYLVAKIRSNKK